MDARTAEIVIRYRRCLAAAEVLEDTGACDPIGEELDQRLTDLGYEVYPATDPDDDAT